MDLLRRRSPCSYTGSQCPTVADSVIGLINLLYEVKMPHIKMQPMAYSTPADSPNRNRSSNANKSFKNNIFSLFSPSQYMAKKERKNLIHLSKNYCRRRRFLSYHLLSCSLLLTTSLQVACQNYLLLDKPYLCRKCGLLLIYSQ
jgi:hypothetical protein